MLFACWPIRSTWLFPREDRSEMIVRMRSRPSYFPETIWCSEDHAWKHIRLKKGSSAVNFCVESRAKVSHRHVNSLHSKFFPLWRRDQWTKATVELSREHGFGISNSCHQQAPWHIWSDWRERLSYPASANCRRGLSGKPFLGKVDKDVRDYWK